MRPFVSSVQQMFNGAEGGTRVKYPGGAAGGGWKLPYANEADSPYATVQGPESTTSVAINVAERAPMSVPSASVVARAWQRILRFCDAQYEELRDTLNWPAPSADIYMLEAAIMQELPQSVREWFLCCNGQELESSTACNDGLFFGLPFLSTEDVLTEWRFWRAVDDDPQTGANVQLRARMGSCPEQWVRHEYSCDGWIPLITDHMGNYIGVDLKPPRSGGGQTGQVIIFGRDFDMKVVVWGCDGAQGWAKFLAMFVEELESGTTWTLDEPDEDEGEEDTIGYETYFTCGGSGTSRGGGDRGGDSQAGFRLTGEYRSWPVLEAWADRSVRQWDAVGLTGSAPASANPQSSASRFVATDAGADIAEMPTMTSSGIIPEPMRPSYSDYGPSRDAERAASVGESTGASTSRSRSVSHAARPMPAPQPLLDLPTIEDVHAFQAKEIAQGDTLATPARNNTLRGLRTGLSNLTRGSSTSYRGVSNQRSSGTWDDGMELAVRSSADLERALDDDIAPRQSSQAIVGHRGNRLRAASHVTSDADSPYTPRTPAKNSALLVDMDATPTREADEQNLPAAPSGPLASETSPLPAS